MKEKGDKDGDKKAPENGFSSPRTIISYYTPSIISSIPFAITFILSLRHSRPDASDTMQDEYEVEEESGINYQYYLYSALTIVTGIIFGITTFGNIAFGRRPDNDDHHNPLYGRLIESASHNLPLAIAIGNSIVHFVTRTAAGGRSEAVNHVISTTSTAGIIAQRADAIDYRLYDHAMDRSPQLDGNMRWLDSVGVRIENSIVTILELSTHSLFLLMNLGVTRIHVNDNNRLYWISSLYLTTTAIEDILVNLSNEEIYYLTRIADIISPFLIAIRLAAPEHPTHAVAPRAIDEVDEKVQTYFRGVKKELEDAGEKVAKFAHTAAERLDNFGDQIADRAEDAWEDIKDFFGGDDEEKKGVDNEDDGGGKMSPEELDKYNQQQQDIHNPTTFHGPYRFGRATMSNAETQTEQDTKENKGNTTIGTSPPSEEENEHNILFNLFSNIFSSNQRRDEANIENETPTTILPMATLNQQQNGSYTIGFPPTIGTATLNIPPEIPNHIIFDNMHFEVRRVPAGEEHHGRTGSYFLEHHRELDEGIDSYRIPVNTQTHTPSHTLIRLDGWEILIYGVGSPFSDGSPSNI